jgi:hypothetical protein
MADSMTEPRADSMADPTVTLRNVFALPEADAPERSSAEWKTFQDKLTEEVKGIKTPAMPDVVAKVGELLDIPIPDIFLASWKKANALQTILDESRKEPETAMQLELAEHTINSQHHPSIEVRIQNTAVKKIEFTVRLAFNLKGFVLKIQNGAIKEMKTGACEVKGTIEYQGLIIAEKKLAPIHLPGTIPLERNKNEDV